MLHERFGKFTNFIFSGVPTRFLKFRLPSFVVPLDVVLFVHTNAVVADEANRFPQMLLKEVA